MEPIQITTGKVSIPIKRDGVDAGKISFNPNDNLFAEHFYALIGEFEAKQDEYDRRSKDLDRKIGGHAGDVNREDAAEAIAFRREVCEYWRAKIDDLFGSGSSQIAFGDAIEPEVIGQFFEGITPFFQNYREEKMRKYLNKDLSGRVMK